MIVYKISSFLLVLLVPIAIIANSFIYAYPFFRQCTFEQAGRHGSAPSSPPFKLLAFGDPQLEGSSSLPLEPTWDSFDSAALWSHVRQNDFRAASQYVSRTTEAILEAIAYKFAYARKQLDLLGNDFYLAHIYRTLRHFTQPTHVAVLGDLLGSQWIDDDEFAIRSSRFWNRVFRGSSAVPADKLAVLKTEAGPLDVHEEELGSDPEWASRIINVAGNHDVGYAGDLDQGRIERFERTFGLVNGMIRFRLNDTGPSLRIVVLNSMNMDSPQSSHTLAYDTINAINDAMAVAEPVEEHNEAVILLTHIPLHKDSGICVDEPMFSYFDDGTIREQNFLSSTSSRDAILQGVFGKHPSTDAAARGMGRDGIILTGHDHEGCDVYHYAKREEDSWSAKRWSDLETASLVVDADQPGMREVTVRSMMGEFGGNAALVSAWWDHEDARWRIEVQNCPFVVQHVWWAVHILDVVLIVITVCWLLSRLSQALDQSGATPEIVKSKEKRSKQQALGAKS